MPVTLKSGRKLSWVDKTKRVIRVEENGSVSFVPVDENNYDYQRLKNEAVEEPFNDDITKRLEAVDVERDRRIDGGFWYDFVSYQSRATDRENIAGACQLAMLAIMFKGAKPGDFRWHGGIEDFTWIAMDNSLVPMDAFTVVEFAQVCAQQKHHLIKQARKLKDRVIAGEVFDFTQDEEWTN